MKYIVDTHILLWTLLDSSKLPTIVTEAYKNAEEIQVCNISLWEISIKYKLGKLDLGALTPPTILSAAKESNFKIINIDATTMSSSYKLPQSKHKDPFDRLLIWHAICSGTTLISRDGAFKQYKKAGLQLLE